MEKKIKHMELVQNVITRMANNSFMLKGWAVTLVAGIFALASKDTNKLYFIVAYVPVVVFWALDAYYLLQEKLYRSLYDKVRVAEDDDIDFSLKITQEEYERGENSYSNCLISPTELGFYLPLLLVCTGIIIITHI